MIVRAHTRWPVAGMTFVVNIMPFCLADWDEAHHNGRHATTELVNVVVHAAARAAFRRHVCHVKAAQLGMCRDTIRNGISKNGLNAKQKTCPQPERGGFIAFSLQPSTLRIGNNIIGAS